MVQALLMLVSVHLDYGFVLLIQVGIHFHFIVGQGIHMQFRLVYQ